MSITDQQIAAYADGELVGEEEVRVGSAIAADPKLARKVKAHRALKDTLGAHFAPIVDQPVPDRLTALLKTKPEVGTAEIVSLSRERHRRGLAPMFRRWAPIAGPAIAASLVLVLWQPWQGDIVPDGYASEQLAAMLDDQLVSTQSQNGAARVLLSFEKIDGEYCRAYRSGDVGGIACKDGAGWQIESEFALGSAQTTEFRQAGSESDLLTLAQEMAVGGALDSEAEIAAKERGWR